MTHPQPLVTKRGIIHLYKIGILFQNRDFEHDVYELIKAFYPGNEIVSLYEEDDADYDIRFRVSRDEEGYTISYNNGIEKKTAHGAVIEGQSSGEASDALISCNDAHDIRRKNKDAIKYALYQMLSKATGKTLPWGTLTGIRPTKIPMELLEEGKEVIQETRRWDDNKESSHAMRSKEDAKDYRYFPDPDLQPMQIPTEWMEQIRSRQPEFQEERAARYEEQYGLPAYDASILTQTKHMADMFEQTADLCGNPKKTANWLMGEGLRLLKEKGMEAEDMDFTPKHLADLIQAIEGGKINQANAKKVFAKILEDDVEPLAYMEKEGLLMVSDSGAIEGAVDQVLAENPKTVEEFHSGKEKVLGFLVGQVMKKMRGKADPGMVNELLRKKL